MRSQIYQRDQVIDRLRMDKRLRIPNIDRCVLFDPGTLRLVSAPPIDDQGGRPRKQWPQSVHNLTLEAAGSIEV